ncbi:MAG TPA: ATP-dependent DNA helicase RecG [Patescibacteria group bacterium]|nr:ATP-dependent DNA helicase RecG [Patescibacteria group bacterium]
MDLSTPLKTLGPVFRMKAKTLEKVGIVNVEDFLFYTPFRYDSNLIVSEIGKAQPGETLTIQGNVTKVSNTFTKRGLSIQKITVEDGTGKIDLTFFNQKFLINTVHEGDFISAAGRIDKFGNRLTMAVRSYEILKSENDSAINTTGLVPVYPQTQNLTSKWIRGRIKTILDQIETLPDYLPAELKEENNLPDLIAALKSIHFPKSAEEANKARQRLSFDELLLKNLASLERKEAWEKKAKTDAFEVKKHQKEIEKLIKSIPFELTNAQKKAVEEIFGDLEKNIPMNRLLQGDVGSGKTVVAGIVLYLAYLNGFQGALMAPTEILANQHYVTIKKLLEPFGIRVELFTSNNKNKEENFDIAIGTHSLIQKGAKFKKLGLIVIDEQQRFGVEQRATLAEKGNNPHVLTMTATPIPRTIFLTIYADLKVSFLNELPKGRQKIKTHLVPNEKRQKGYAWISEKIKTEKSQVFIVCPFIEPSETLATVKAVTEEVEHLKKNVFPNFKLGLLHGKMKTADKDKVVADFKAGKLDILVATPVIEVGIDIPTADIMLIEASERFGLAQLHQLRGRVGRGQKQSYCFLFTESKSDKTVERLTYLQTIDNGAELAEVDLKLRGPGEMFGTMQHGIPDLKIANLSDYPLFELARKEAEKIYPSLKKYPNLVTMVQKTDTPKISKD